MNLESVGFTPTTPEHELERTIEALQQLREALIKARQAFKSRRMRELDTELANAWMIYGEAQQRVDDVKKRLEDS